MQRALVWPLALVFIGCGGTQETPSPSATQPTVATVTPTGTTAPYEVHEWGLLRAGAGDVLDVGAISPPGSYEAMAVDKPVLYFHASGQVRLEHVRVEAVGGAIREHWPLTGGAAFPTSIDWRGLSLDGSVSAGGAGCAGAFPTSSSRPCSDLARGEECETQGLGIVVSPSATCLQGDYARQPFLFYRSRTATFTPPLRVSALPSGELELTNAGDLPIPGWVVRIRRTGGLARTLAMRAPAAHATIRLGSNFASAVAPVADIPPSDESERASDSPAPPGSEEPGRQAVRITLRELGLDAGETDAFLRAWDATLFGDRMVPLVDRPRRAADGDRAPIDVLTVDSRMAASDSILYFLPEATCDGVARLSFVPAPTRVRRALAVWQLAR